MCNQNTDKMERNVTRGLCMYKFHFFLIFVSTIHPHTHSEERYDANNNEQFFSLRMLPLFTLAVPPPI